ncbi:MAG: Crp/Fnr family transcriptional regulator [Gammaproteobacteria bacterium]|nr:Crp/Fnr family transcriptional regulator [Rhodocyclaceae bacterium]MBU3908190.1 Crp/Fnr family transcriptional regulator [Gammaproteobacteria bacterium]MBU3988382.1 Crp/Fnr family transcriptional regulator [Gammaproteobacteria bacterium]MBU4005985.1 Crp/Fnr family transcriptional regulator [Gammaproteobacteria bacterium]MBU4020009.1 Crp/Fnr family transcriptional regulator [Gammaproteobacteria bacterium]
MESHLLTLLKRTPLFGDLPTAQLAQLAAATAERRYARGDVVLEKGARLTGLHVVLSGKLKEFCRAPGGEEKVIEILGAGQTCGEAALFLDTPYPFHASALSNAVLLHIEKQAIDGLVEGAPEFVIRMLQVLAERQNTSLRDIEAYSRSSLLQRLVTYLLELCRASGEETPSITLPAMKQVVASRLNMAPEVLSRTFRDLADAGLIEMRGKRVILLDPVRLREFTRQN